MLPHELADITRWKKTLDSHISTEEEIGNVLTLLTEVNVDRDALSKTKVGLSVGRLKLSPNLAISGKARKLIEKWKAAVKNPQPKGPSGSSQALDSGAACFDSKSSVQVGEYPGPYDSDPRRNKAREILYRAFLEGMPEDQLAVLDLTQAGQVSASTEEALWSHHIEANNNYKEYQAQLRSIKSNLADKKNPEFNVRILVGAIGSAELATMLSIDMASDAKKRERQKAKKDALEACQSDWDLRNIKRAAGQFPCGKCKSSNTSYFQLQTRSSDEPMTTSEFYEKLHPLLQVRELSELRSPLEILRKLIIR